MSTPRLTLDEVREAILIDGLPPGARDLWDFDNPDSNVYIEIDADAQALKAHGTDQVAILRDETLATTVSQNIPTWEAALGFTGSRIARFGTASQRVGQIVSRLREWGTPSIPNIKAAFAALCGYVPNVLEHTRADVDLTGIATRDVNPYPFGGPGDPIDPAATTTYTTSYGDVGKVTNAGARVYLRISHPTPIDLELKLSAPSGAYIEWTGGATFGDADYRILWWPDCAGLDIAGTWTLEWTNVGVTAGEIEICLLTVDSVGRDPVFSTVEGSAARIWEWSVAIDEALCGSGYDRGAAIALARRWNPAHCDGGVALYMTDGDLCALSDDPSCLADLAVAC